MEIIQDDTSKNELELKLLEKEKPNKETLESIKAYEECNFKTAKNSKDLFQKLGINV